MTRAGRERAILDAVERDRIETQQDLVRALRRRGLDVTQATVSRDVKRLGLVKVASPEGRRRYARPGRETRGDAVETMRREFEEHVTGLDQGQGLIVIHTLTGRAHAVAVTLDEADLPEVAGTVAGDDTILVVPRTRAGGAALLRRLRGLLG